MKKLTPKQQRFVDEYLIDLNATQAAIRAGYSARTAAWIGTQLLTKTHIADKVNERITRRSQRTEITQDMVLERWWELANADANDLVEYRRNNCRHCWGMDHGYQWTEHEFEAARNQALEKGDEAPDCAGGFGYSSTRAPNPDCPECHGEGMGTMHVHDTRRLQGAARRLYAGLKQSKDGLQVLMADREKALENVARHLGMFNDKLELNVTGPLAERLARARARNG